MGKIDFKQVAAAALNSLENLLNQWLPSGKRNGHEYASVNPTRSDSKPGSFSINLNTGAWADFATDDKGGDAISLRAYLFGETQLDAAKALADQLGIISSVAVAGRAPVEKKSRSDWSPIVPVPDNRPAPPVAHVKRGKPDASWKYHTASGGLVGFICRFTTSDGGKEILPLSYCQHATTGAQEWRWMAFPEPRPLYVPGAWREGVTKLIVEGEKCAVVAHALLDECDAVSWAGGCKAIDKSDWSRFAEGDKVLLWPDCDAQTDKDGVLLPEAKQPGVAAMSRIAQKLLTQGCKVRIVVIPAPGEKPSGWDIADALAEGMDAEAVRELIKRQRAASAEKKQLPATPASAGMWDDQLFLKNGAFRECRENIFLVLQHHPEWTGCLAMDEFANVIKCRRDTPVGLKAGELWDEHQDFKLGLWLARELHLFVKADGMISTGVRASAVENKYHPVRDWLDTLAWDGVPRLQNWLSDFAGVAESEYARHVGRLFLIGMVARIYRPGCKMDTALILEGLQGEGKSSIARALAGEWFSDTTFVMGDKDSFLALRGRWAYELAELDSFNRSESTRAKAFISSSTDSYRAPYDRVTKDHARQCVFIGTTNQYEYFKDASGNRRYWPVMCSSELNVAGLLAARDLLFAEAVQAFHGGAHWWPNKADQDRLFTPEQELREVSDPWELAIHEWLRHGLENEVSALGILTGALKMEVSKIDGARQATMRVGVCMRKLGWGKKRKSSGAREWVYVRPNQNQQGVNDEAHPF